MYVYLYLINYSNQKKTLVRKIIYPDIILSSLHRAFIKYRIYMRYILYRHICINIQVIAGKQIDRVKTL